MKKRIAALLLALVMMLSLIPTTVFAEGTVTVTFAAQDQGSFVFTPQSVTVTDGLAEEYGYTVATADHNRVPVEGPTVFDALVAVHKAIYGDKFTKDTAKTYLSLSGTMLNKVFEKSTSSISFMVNGEMPSDGIAGTYGYTGYAADTARLKNNDVIDLWIYQSSYWADYYTYFTETAKTVKVNEAFTLTMKGFMAMSAMGYDPNPIAIDGTDAVITINTFANGALSEALKDTNNQEITPNASGEVTLSFAKAGTYLVTANGYTEDNSPIVAPWCYVTVVDDQAEADKVIDLINAIGNVSLNSGSAIQKARVAYNALTDAQKALVSKDVLKLLTDAEAAYNALAASTGSTGNNVGPAKNPFVKDDAKTDGKAIESAKTGDAGVTLYVGMGLVAVLAGAVVIGRKRKAN